MIVTSRRDRNSGDAKGAGTSRSPLLRLPMRSEFFRPSKNQELLAPAAPDCAWFKSIEQDLRRRARLEAECLAEFNQPAALSTYQRGKSVRTTRATADITAARAMNLAKDELALLKLASFGTVTTAKKCLRHDKNVLQVHGVEGDYDGEVVPMSQAAEALSAAGVAAVLYSSASHTPERPRW